MTTLHIEHPVTDLDVWLAAFNRMAGARTKAGVTAQRVLHPVDDPNYILVELDFPTTEEAQRFLTFLKSKVWSSNDNAPALDGTPQTRHQSPKPLRRLTINPIWLMTTVVASLFSSFVLSGRPLPPEVPRKATAVWDRFSQVGS
jgi:hypothetical protein